MENKKPSPQQSAERLIQNLSEQAGNLKATKLRALFCVNEIKWACATISVMIKKRPEYSNVADDIDQILIEDGAMKYWDAVIEEIHKYEEVRAGGG